MNVVAQLMALRLLARGRARGRARAGIHDRGEARGRDGLRRGGLHTRRRARSTGLRRRTSALVVHWHNTGRQAATTSVSTC